MTSRSPGMRVISWAIATLAVYVGFLYTFGPDSTRNAKTFEVAIRMADHVWPWDDPIRLWGIGFLAVGLSLCACWACGDLYWLRYVHATAAAVYAMWGAGLWWAVIWAWTGHDGSSGSAAGAPAYVTLVVILHLVCARRL